jgi:hypothetical protein
MRKFFPAGKFQLHPKFAGEEISVPVIPAKPGALDKLQRYR